jgi:hypothetical protein
MHTHWTAPLLFRRRECVTVTFPPMQTYVYERDSSNEKVYITGSTGRDPNLINPQRLVFDHGDRMMEVYQRDTLLFISMDAEIFVQTHLESSARVVSWTDAHVRGKPLLEVLENLASGLHLDHTYKSAVFVSPQQTSESAGSN